MEPYPIKNRLQALLKENPNLTVIGEKVKCALTGHEMPLKESAILQYLNGKKYKRIMSKSKFDFKDFEPMIVTSSKKGHENHLFCTLTLRHINKTPPHVLRHVSGKRYQKAKARWEECQKTGSKFVPTPLLSKPYKFKEGETSSEGNADKESSDDEEFYQGNDDLTDLYPVKFFEKLSLEEATANEQAECLPRKKESRKRAKPVTKPMKSSKPAAKRKRANLIVST